MPKQKRPPADPSSGPAAQFGYELRQLRQDAQLTYAALAQRSYYSASALHRADQGHVLPSENLTRSYVRACNGDVEAWLLKRKEIAVAAEAGKPPPSPRPTPKTRGLAAPDPTEATSPVEYIDALKRLREWSGLTYRDMERIAADYARPLPMSTVCAALRRGTLPQRDLVESIVRAVGLAEADQVLWLGVRDAIANGQPVPREPTWRRWTTGSRQLALTRPRLPPEDDVVAIEDDVVPVAHLVDEPLQLVRDWHLVGGRWQSTDELQAERSRERWAARASRAWAAVTRRWRRST
ncbi:helix-turn-helix domain-containing protein [Dactylosporangium sp. CA-092794]|uniref:helix-turn-helix domain-containing protein n=1 Tax=Dactylosporangium sp. CA-092794 TaxID=3239929 RepID=UPI003D902B0F